MAEQKKAGHEIAERPQETEEHRRRWRNKRHELRDILFIALCAIISGLEDFGDMVIFGEERLEWLGKSVALSGCRKGGVGYG